MKRKLIRCLFALPAFLGLTLLLTACGSKLPAYNSDEKVGPQINYTITGIDASAGEMDKARKALDIYNLKKHNWQLMPSSTAAMTSMLDKAIKNHQPIVITAYQPHWMFAKYPIKFLKDPKNVFGKNETMRTIARLGLKKDNPGAYKLLKQFSWTIGEASPVMLKINNGTEPTKAAKDFIKSHPQRVAQYLKNVPAGHGKKIKLVYTPYDYETATTNVVKQLLDKKGYDVTIQQLDVQVMWTAIATDKADASMVAELPATHAVYAKNYSGKYDEIRVNLKGARIGLAVPKYMKKINSIEDLYNK
ncbi:glycine betaine ABC transport system [Liquorilactobacillus sucicola DSM 21376 = JCM 15457]|uniref:Glycine betaine carnitine abc transporter, substrate binding lipoprotein n=1 Tax=Liquorilactobacillus sucicola DSM 21376 = JCM 15457 TaxID=1423806 RepID=A0A023CXC4_9LACO|nr:glycine betaine ABC transporter substrate-binding protein [Liquorilactobacillus sucicola]KRN07054.1 glycine betaine carnitine abc transporter, substrate binding lipoprotein [Liquorilactobacillus sucicola DSM 21376 = JCM 15457]GAJ26548.1 glycine betaine ABC transport system [Liquorilactobacillus sucicola DSM 21376 = JCM 15457]